MTLGAHAGPDRWRQSRPPSTPIWRLGVQCERSVRDPIGLAALAVTNQVVRPDGLGMETDAPHLPYRAAHQPTGGSREKNGSASYDVG